MHAMRAHLDGLPVTEAASMPPGAICGLCARDLHRFVYPKDIPGSRWSLMDGCPCCETHVGDEPPLPAGKAGSVTDPHDGSTHLAACAEDGTGAGCPTCEKAGDPQ